MARTAAEAAHMPLGSVRYTIRCPVQHRDDAKTLQVCIVVHVYNVWAARGGLLCSIRRFFIEKRN